MSLSGHIVIWSFLEWRALNGTEMPLSWVGLWLGRDSGMQLSLNYYATDQGKRWGDRWVTQKELLRNELICLCKYTHVLSSRHKASLLRGPFIWALLWLQLIEIFSQSWGWRDNHALETLPRVPISQHTNCDRKELLINVPELSVFLLGQGTRLASLPHTAGTKSSDFREPKGKDLTKF